MDTPGPGEPVPDDHSPTIDTPADAGRRRDPSQITTTPPDLDDDFAPPERIGPYRLLQPLGEGGMGIVYLAEQTEPIRRRVALKLIKPGMDSRAVVARFQAERQSLALMNHPNIAKVYDAGATDRALPYFVMEFVQGVPITQHCDEQRLSIPDRIRLFLRVCDAVQHAHNKGVIHRDLKPSNILVAYENGVATPKVIDFGVAKAVNAEMESGAAYTRLGQLVGTPEYMSPEQAEMSPQDIDTRADVYSLGVVLYQLLTGDLPFNPKTLRDAALSEIHRIIREVDPPRPSVRLSTRISSHKSDPAELARLFKTDTRHLLRALRTDLDWVVMRCLEKDRERRYETPSALALDLQRYLSDQPVLAGPPSAGYRIRKFVRRNRTGVGAAAVVVLALVSATGISISFALSEAHQRRIADEERAIADAVNTFLNDELLAQAAPEHAGRDARVIDMLDNAAAALDAQANLPARVEAALRRTIGFTYLRTGAPQEGERHLRRAVDLYTSLGPEHAQDRAFAQLNLAESHYRLRIPDEAPALTNEAYETLSRLLPPTDPRLLDARQEIANALKWAGEIERARDLYRSILNNRSSATREQRIARAGTLHNLALAESTLRDFPSALEHMKQSLAIRASDLGRDHPNTINTLAELALIHYRLDDFDSAAPLYTEAIPLAEKRLGPHHWRTLQTKANLATLYVRTDRPEHAAELFLAIEPLYPLAYSANHANPIEISRRTGASLRALDRNSEAEGILLNRYNQTLGAPNADRALIARAANNLAEHYNAVGNAEEAARWRSIAERHAPASPQ